MSENLNTLLNSYDIKSLPNSWLSALRSDSRKSIATMTAPTTRDEDWKYTSLSGLQKISLKTSVPCSVDAEEIKKHKFDNFINIVFVNGHFSNEFSDSLQIVGLRAASLADLNDKDHSDIKKINAANQSANKNYFHFLNNSILNDGLFLKVDKNFKNDKKINLVFYNAPSDTCNTCTPSNFLLIEPLAEVSILETHLGCSGEFFTSYSAEILVEENATLKLYRLQQEGLDTCHISNVATSIKKDANFEFCELSIGSKLTRNFVEVNLQAQGAQCSLDGLYLPKDQQHIDNHSIIDHQQPNCISNQYYKGILDSGSRGVFNGRILVRKDAQQTKAFQLNKNLLLSDNAEIDTKPQLEIDADDVKCSHGATVGQLNNDEIFYLQTRGLTKEEAQKMLSYAFSEEIILRISDKCMQNKINELLSSKIKGF